MDVHTAEYFVDFREKTILGVFEIFGEGSFTKNVNKKKWIPPVTKFSVCLRLSQRLRPPHKKKKIRRHLWMAPKWLLFFQKISKFKTEKYVKFWISKSSQTPINGSTKSNNTIKRALQRDIKLILSSIQVKYWYWKCILIKWDFSQLGI